MFLILNLADILKISYINFVRITLIIGLIVSNFCVYFLKKILIEYMENKNEKIEIFTWIISFVIIYNFTYIDNLYFVECIVMAIGLLLTLKAVDQFYKNNIFKALILMFLSTFCYQIIPMLFVVFCMLIECLKQEKIKTIIKNVFLSGCLLGITYIIHYMCISVFHKILYIEKELSRASDLALNKIDLNVILYNIEKLVEKTYEIVITNHGIFYKYAFVVFWILFFMIFIYIWDFNKESFIKFLGLTFGIYLFSNIINIFTLYRVRLS